MAIGSHIARTSLVYYFNVLLLSLRGIILIPFLLHTFGSEQYGLYVLSLSGVSYGVVLAQFGLDTSIYQYLTPVRRTEAARVVFWTAIQTAAMFACILILSAIGSSILFLSSAIADVAIACSVIAAGQVVWGLSLTPFRCEERSILYMGLSIAVMLGDFVLTVTMVLLSRNLEATFIALSCYHVAVAILFLSVQSTRLPYHSWSVIWFRKLIQFGLNGLVNQLVVGGYFVWDRAIISIAAGLTAVAAYAPGMAMGAIILPLAGTSVFTLPTLLVQPEIHRSPTLKRSIMRKAIRQYALIAIPAAVGAALISGPFLNVIMSASLAYTATRVAWLACGAVFASGLSRFAILALRADGEDKWLSKNLIMHFVAFVLLALGLSIVWPQETPILVAASILLVNMSQAVAAFGRLRLHVTNVLAPVLFLTPAVGAAAFFSLPFLFPVQGLAAILGLVAISIAIYALVTMTLEGVGPRKLIRLLREPAALDEVSTKKVSQGNDKTKAVILYSGPNHLFVSVGIFYAAELAEEYEVHTILDEYGRDAITQSMLTALARRNINVHWLPDARGLKKHEVYHEFAHSLIEDVQPCGVFLDNDMGVFDIVLARCARDIGARVVCFQTGQLPESLAIDFELLNRGKAVLWARSHRLPSSLAYKYVVARLHAVHIWHYYLGPCLAGYRPYPGSSSLFLRRSHTGRRDGEFYLAYEPGGSFMAAKEGTPEHKIIPVGHPLLRDTGKRLFSELFPLPDYIAENSALLLIDFPSEVVPARSVGETPRQNWTSSFLVAVSALAKNLSSRYAQIIVKPHPGLERYAGFLEELELALQSVPGVRFVKPSINAIGFLSSVKIVVGGESTVLKFARYFPELIVVSTNYSSTAQRRPFHADEIGINVFNSWREAVAADLSLLSASRPQSGCPEGVDPDATVVNILRQRRILKPV